MKMYITPWFKTILFFLIIIVLSGCQAPPTNEDIVKAIRKTDAINPFNTKIQVIKIGKKDKVTIDATYNPNRIEDISGGKEFTDWFVKAKIIFNEDDFHREYIESFFVFKNKGEWDARDMGNFPVE